LSFEGIISLDLPNVLAVIAIAASPISELRGAIPIAISAFHFPWYYAFILAIIGNLLPVPFILLFFDSISRLLSKIGFFQRMLWWFFERTKRRGKVVERYERIGLALFVAIPLPVTGAWTGSVAAVLFGLKFKHAFLSIFIGVLVAGAIVTCATLLGWTIYGLFETQGK
jgi:uncharacterized membrane protein